MFKEPLRGENVQEYFLEGAFRNIHTRLRTHAESVAFFGGGRREGNTIARVFHDLLTHLRSVVDVRCSSARWL